MQDQPISTRNQQLTIGKSIKITAIRTSHSKAKMHQNAIPGVCPFFRKSTFYLYVCLFVCPFVSKMEFDTNPARHWRKRIYPAPAVWIHLQRIHTHTRARARAARSIRSRLHLECEFSLMKDDQHADAKRRLACGRRCLRISSPLYHAVWYVRLYTKIQTRSYIGTSEGGQLPPDGCFAPSPKRPTCDFFSTH